MRVTIEIKADEPLGPTYDELVSRMAECLACLYGELQAQRCPRQIIEYFIDILEGNETE